MDVYQHMREAVRVKVKKCEANVPVEWRKFSVDPQITTLEVLYSLLAKAFDIKSDFSIKYKAFDPAGNEIYLAVLSDWDLDAAFLRIHNLAIQTASEPCLVLQIDIKPFTEVKECDADTPTAGMGSGSVSVSGSSTVSSGSNSTSTSVVNQAITTANAREMIAPLQQSLGASQKYVQQMRLPGLIMNQMEKTFSIVQKAFNLSEETMAALPPRPPLSDNEFRLFLDALGQIQRTDELRKVIFFGGIEPGLRRVVWKHILNVYPSGMNGHQRMDYMRRKSEQYCKLRETWKTAVKQGCVVGELGYVTSMVKKDVLRTDRLHPFYAGSDDNQNIASLFNILTTYALNHPTVSYCQGMSDIASPLLVTMNDEAQAYICFCAIMVRVRGNFMLDGIAMTQKFAHLSEALSFYDQEFWDYLKAQQADDLLFCYRWLLLELKREFPFEDALRMLEVQWSSLKYETSVNNELALFEKEFVPIMETSAPTTASSISSSLSTTGGGGGPTSPSYLLAKPRENPYTKFCALRRQSSTASLSSLSSSLGGSANILDTKKLDSSKRLNQSLDDNISRHMLTRRQRQVSSKAHQSLDEAKMLMLIENAENCEKESAANSKSNEPKSPDSVADDDDAEASTHFRFHPTNPFKDDAQQLISSKDVSVKMDKPVARVFLSSTSSSFAEDDNTADIGIVETPKSVTQQIPSSSVERVTNNNLISNIIAKQLVGATAVSETVKRVGNSGGGHFKDLKDKIAATSKKGLSFDELTNTSNAVKPPQKLVKNFNEFLNFANVNKSRIADKFAGNSVFITPDKSNKPIDSSPTHMPTQPPTSLPQPPPIITHPVVQLTKSSRVPSLEDSDSTCSVPDTTWSNSTAATAIQQAQNLSSNSLQLELNSFASSANYTPDRTPCTFSPLRNELAHDAYATPDDQQDTAQDYYPITTAITRELRLEADNLDRQVFGDSNPSKPVDGKDIEYEKLDTVHKLDTIVGLAELNLKENEIIACNDFSELLRRRRKRGGGKSKVENTATERRTDNDDSFGTSSNSSSNYRLAFDSWDEDSDVDDNAAAIDGQREPSSFTTAITTTTSTSFKNAMTARKSNPFIDENFYSSPPVAGLPNSNSLPEVLVPISTDTLDTSAAVSGAITASAPVELATNAVDVAEQAEITSKCLTQPPHTVSTAAELNGIAFTPTATTLPAAPVLPPPHQFGGGNPFLMFLCLTLLLQHRNTIIKSGMDYNEIAMHFDKMVRKHDVTRVLNQARRMYIDYLKVQNAYKQRMQQAAAAAKGVKKTTNSVMEKQSQQLQQQQQLSSTQSIALMKS